MGYACPVCATPQRDGEHLAHHLAFTAMIHGDDHEAWLDEHAPGWQEQDPEGLASEVTPHAEETAYPEVFEDTTEKGRPDVDVDAHAGGQGHQHAGGHGHGGGHGGGHDHGHGAGGGRARPDPADLDPDAAEALREARELTREMYENGEESDGDDSDDTDA